MRYYIFPQRRMRDTSVEVAIGKCNFLMDESFKEEKEPFEERGGFVKFNGSFGILKVEFFSKEQEGITKMNLFLGVR